MSVTHDVRPKGKYATVDWTAAELKELEEKAVGVYSHSKSGSVHALAGAGANIKFISTANFADGDTWTVNGAVVAAKTVDGQGLHTGDIVAGSVVLAVLDGEVLCFQIRSYYFELDGKVNYYNLESQAMDVFSGMATGIYRCSGWINYPPKAPDGQGMVIALEYQKLPSGASHFCSRIFVSPHNGELWVNTCTAGTWIGWKSIALVAPLVLSERQMIVDKDLEIIELRRMMTDLDLTVRGGDSSGQGAD